MSKIEFSYTQTDMFGKTEKTYNVSTNNLHLDDLLEDFDLFLRGAGFVIPPGYILDIVQVDSDKPESYEVTTEMINKMAEQHSQFFFDEERNK